MNPYKAYPQPPLPPDAPPPLPRPWSYVYGYCAAPQHIPDWLSLSDELWDHILSFVGASDKLKNVARSCRQLSLLLAKPHTTSIWGDIKLGSHAGIETSVSLVWFSGWLHRRAAGIRSVTYIDRGVHTTERSAKCEAAVRIWHVLVGATAGTHVRLVLMSENFTSGLGAPVCFIQPPLTAELSSRLTALDVEVAAVGDYGLLAGLTALVHLRLGVADRGTQDDQPHFDADAFRAQWDVRWSRLRTLWLADSLVPLPALFSEAAVAALSQLQALRLNGLPDRRLLGEQPMQDGVPDEVFRMTSLTRLDLEGMRSLTAVPDLTGLPNLLSLSLGMYSQLALSTAGQHIGGATGLRRLSLHGTPLRSQACVDAILSLPALRLLHLDFWSDPAGAFWAAVLKQRLGGGCCVSGNDTNRWVGVDDDCF